MDYLEPWLVAAFSGFALAAVIFWVLLTDKHHPIKGGEEDDDDEKEKEKEKEKDKS